MPQNEHKLFDGNNEYTVKLVFSDYEGAIHQTYGMVFHCFPQGEEKPKAISIAVSSLAIDMWTAIGGNKDILEDKEVFAWQIAQTYLPQLEKSDVIKLFIHRDDNAPTPEGFIPIKAAPTISETARLIKFGGKRPTDTQIRREILKVCFNEYQNNPHGYVYKVDLLKFIPATDTELERNIKYLHRGGFLEAKGHDSGYTHLQISNHGIDVFSDPEEFNRVFQLKVEQTTNNIGGDMIVTHLTGTDNKNIVKSQIKETAEKKKKSI